MALTAGAALAGRAALGVLLGSSQALHGRVEVSVSLVRRVNPRLSFREVLSLLISACWFLLSEDSKDAACPVLFASPTCTHMQTNNKPTKKSTQTPAVCQERQNFGFLWD